eukprot:scaffold185924_cov67-Cyclotella_meneghiniana.AAC.10
MKDKDEDDAPKEGPNFTKEWFELKEQEILARDNPGADLPEETVKIEPTDNQDAVPRAVLIDDQDAPPQPTGMRMETDNLNLAEKNTKNLHSSGPQSHVDTDGSPLPACMISDSEETMEKKKPFCKQSPQVQDMQIQERVTLCSDTESISRPSRETETIENIMQIDPAIINRTNPETASLQTGSYIGTLIEAAEALTNGDDVEEQRHAANSGNYSHAIISLMPEIAEAYVVDDENVFIATPTENRPWWKQRRTKVLFAFVILLLATVLAVSLKIGLSPERTITAFVALTASPTMSRAPSVQPSSSPTSSLMPSSAPSACSDRIVTNTRRIDLLTSNPSGLKFALDGTNLVIAWEQFPGSIGIKGSFYTAFYSLQDGRKWVSAGYFIEGNVILGGFDSRFDVDISGRTAIIGLPVNNVAYVYMQNTAGLWEKVPSIEPTNQVSECGGFGVSVHVCENLAVVSDSSNCQSPYRSWSRPSNSASYFYEPVGGEWVEIGRNISNLDWYDDDDTDKAMSLPYDIYAMKYPVCLGSATSPYYASAYQDGVAIYKQDPNSTTSTFIQNFNSSEYTEGFGQEFAVSDGVLVVGSNNYTHFFSETNGVWEEILKLDKSYDAYELSGRILIAAKGADVYSINIEDCTPQMPTKPPSTGMNRECYYVNITSSRGVDEVYDYDDDSSQVSEWEVTIRTETFLESDSTAINSVTQSDSTTCLYPGLYEASFATEWWGCYNVSFDFPDWPDEGFTFSGCSYLGGSIDSAVFDVPRTKLIRPTLAPLTPYPTTSPTTSFSPSNTWAPTHHTMAPTFARITPFPTAVSFSPTESMPPVPI